VWGGAVGAFDTSDTKFSDTGKAYEIWVALPGFEAKTVDVPYRPTKWSLIARVRHGDEHKDKAVPWSEFQST